jgi:hypothetical protein
VDSLCQQTWDSVSTLVPTGGVVVFDIISSDHDPADISPAGDGIRVFRILALP